VQVVIDLAVVEMPANVVSVVDSAVAVHLVVEEIPLAEWKCTKQFVMIVERIVKFLLNQLVIKKFSVVIVSTNVVVKKV
jgi:hypothetical protein